MKDTFADMKDDLPFPFKEDNAPSLAAVLKTADPLHVENCTKCGGTGIYSSYHGSCFKCHGTGRLTFKQPRAVRAQARAKAAERAAAKPAKNWATFEAAHPAQAAWILANPNFEFAVSLKGAAQKYSKLSENQLAAIDRCIAKAAAPKVDRSVAVANSVLRDALLRAKAAGLQYPKLRLDTMVFSLAPQTGNNAGSVYAKSGDVYKGKITDGRFYPSRECTTEEAKQVAELMADPVAVMTSYGLRTGSCSLCGRALINKTSVELGIGPICRDKWGF